MFIIILALLGLLIWGISEHLFLKKYINSGQFDIDQRLSSLRRKK